MRFFSQNWAHLYLSISGKIINNVALFYFTLQHQITDKTNQTYRYLANLHNPGTTLPGVHFSQSLAKYMLQFNLEILKEKLTNGPTYLRS
jgi:hypothetical protein